ncbi:MAG: ABC transporter substrate-binding protein [Acutalibacter sp.]|jgi:putative aldouronate transport system substrate-binding protein|uniref:ABC transporter substrate-binding protein n=1 Tax=Acutalibacter sp. TaxID=1918636 RepID=UPI00216C4C36|nr:ABC transporter substrate-binding protein [Acutalibacter sp.]MCI9225622.1 ABC transporter substrate-binding protein [Acutalibacter sp.]
MKLARKLTAAILVLALVLSLGACGGSGGSSSTPGESKTESKPESSEASETTESSEPETGDTPDYSEKLTISYAAVAMVEGVDYNADELSKHFQEKFNIEWEPIALTWDNWGEKNRIWINSGDMPDFVMWDFNYGDYMNYTDQGLIRKLPDGWKERWPNMAKVYKNTGIADSLEEKVGGAYMIPRVIYFDMPTDPLVSHTNLWIRQDWARDVGFEVKEKYSPKEIMEYARLIKEADPVGNGKTLPIDMSPDNLATLFISPYNAEYADFHKDESGKYIWGAAEESTLEGLKLYSEAYREGLINADFFALKNQEEVTHYYSGIAGAIYYQGFGRSLKLTSERYAENAGGDPKTDLHMAYIVGDDGKFHAKEISNYWTASIFSPTMDDKKFERLMDLLEYSASDEGQNLIRMGFEGKDWSRDDNGDITILREKGEDGNFVNLDTIYPSLNPLYNNLSILPDGFGLVDPGLDKDIMEIVDERFAGKQRDGCDQGTVVPIDWDLNFFTSPNYEKTKYKYGEEFAKLIVMDGDIEANWRAWVEEKMPQVNVVLDEINAEFGK